MTGVVIAGFGASDILRKTDRSITDLSVEAILKALSDAQLSADDVDGYVGAPFATNAGSPHAEGGDEISLKTVAGTLGLPLTYGADLFRRYPTDMVSFAANALAAGTSRYVIGLRAMYNLPGLSYATSGADQAFGNDQFTKPFGFTTAGARFGARAQRYMATHGVTREDLYEVVALARRHAAMNPDAVWRDKGATLEDYLKAPMIATPHGLLDCDMPVCGAMAFVMCREGDLPAGATPARVTGFSGFTTPKAVFDMSGRSIADVTQAQLYDGFSSMIWEWLEDFGFCDTGAAWKFIRDGHANAGARLPLNTFGGSLGEGRMHGMGHLREAYLQASGKAGDRQQANVGPILVHNGPFDDSSFLMIEPAK
ncbi:MAG: thiolase family protein [Pseudomonadota bacterium]|nr:thiolase family protein [Pseudomonadota bacterium]